MVKIALVEDTDADALLTSQALDRFAGDEGLHFEVTRYTSAEDFLTDARARLIDMIFLDIEMPGADGLGMDGMTAAQQYRSRIEIHGTKPIIFTTKVAQLAAKGYEVSAVGYLIKPFDYATFALTMKRALAQVELNADAVDVKIPSAEGTFWISSRVITYIEVRDHLVYVHTEDGKVFTVWGSLKEYAAQLEGVHFMQCHRYCLVNLQHVSGFTDKELLIGSGDNVDRVSMSRGKKAAVLDALLAMKSGL
ncbi:LytTR family DNA-binding domain-containing protein [Alloscardovia omnicolens]|uniref:LytR/AlgR family response regulator transcription factor n=1 Tax=Alloscardovia omnicolens TaxID=419015 RepID=UPI0028F133F6|nr:LytTR family DNA-binding domain-containing protein [Alloscardovia omnicolens]